MSHSDPNIPAETARHVLWHFGADGGWQPGTFTQHLLHAIATADHGNFEWLRTVYPAEVAAVGIATSDKNGIATLQKIAAGGQ
ncbi:hypothetical protein [Streptomyces sp. URMC 124]|uniref:hypothetical protein n=1 Tax=Streptomyces sp. URMC 124 TaxID=3423405 RepID=UPI003F1C5067